MAVKNKVKSHDFKIKEDIVPEVQKARINSSDISNRHYVRPNVEIRKIVRMQDLIEGALNFKECADKLVHASRLETFCWRYAINTNTKRL